MLTKDGLRNEKGLDWFLKRHKDFLSNVDYTDSGNNKRGIIDEYFTKQEQKIISCGLSNLYMFEKFRGCLVDAPNLPLDQFQELCFFGGVSLHNKYPILAEKGRINEEKKKERQRKKQEITYIFS